MVWACPLCRPQALQRPSPPMPPCSTSTVLKTSLRYVLQLITTANLVAQKRKSSVVELDDVKRVYHVFQDLTRWMGQCGGGPSLVPQSWP